LNQYILMTVLLMLAMLAIVALVKRRRKHSKARPLSAIKRPERVRRGILHIARLTGFTLLAFLVIFGGVLAYVSYQSLNEDMLPAPSQVEVPPDLPFQVEAVAFPGGDGLTMAGWYVPAQNGATIILLHGYSANRTGMLWHASVLVKAGYGVLMYDERASGESEGDYRSYGWEDPADVGGALAYLASRPDAHSNRVGIAGCSIGGQIALQAAARYPQLEAVWADGPATVNTRDIPAPFNWFTLLSYPSNLLMDRMLSDRIHRAVPPAIIEIIRTIEPRPVMLVAGGQTNPLFGAESVLTGFMFQHAGPNASLWVIPEATHCDGPVQRPEEYAEKFSDFFDKAFAISR
jgi:pimeloyl-ACP methyl ester carboxylesterase